jgi:predicted phosphodiesterase
LAVLADVHDNLLALEAVVEDMQHHKVDGVIAAGDYVVRGPYPVETSRLLRSLDGWMIRGNAEGYLLAYDAGEAPAPWCSSDQWAAMRWTYTQLDRETLDFIAGLPQHRVVTVDGAPPIRVVHGSPTDPSGRLFPDEDPDTLRWFRKAGLLAQDGDPPPLRRAFAQISEPVLVCAHTHIPWVQEQDGRLAFNPGAVSGALNGDARAQYALLTWENGRWQVEHRAVAYDLTRVRRAFRDTGFLAEGGPFAKAFLLSIETGRNVVGHLFSHIDRFALEAGLEDWVVVPEAIWDRAVNTFRWAEYGGESRRAEFV